MKNWLIYSMGAIFFWGVWSFLCKFASLKGMNWKGIFIYTGFSYIPLIVYFIFSTSLQVPGTTTAKVITVIAGLFSSSAVLCFYAAITTGKLSIVLPMTSLYPAISIILAMLFFEESLSIYNMVGIVLALIAIVLLVHE